MVKELQGKHIMDFRDEWVPMHWTPKADGFYMTIRCGLGGIYYKLNEWKDNKWQMGVADGSDVIAYSANTISPEEVKEWAEDLKAKVKEKYKKQ